MKHNSYLVWNPTHFFSDDHPEEEHKNEEKQLVKDSVQTLSFSQLILIKMYAQLIEYLLSQKQAGNIRNPQRQ